MNAVNLQDNIQKSVAFLHSNELLEKLRKQSRVQWHQKE